MAASTITSQRSPASLSWDHKLGLGLAFLIAQGSVMYACYWAGHTDGIRESDGILGDLPYTLDGLHIVISFCLGVCVVGLWFRRGWGLIISSLALVSILVTYGYWHFKTIKYLSELGNNMAVYRRVQQEVGWFHGATKWDFVVLILVAILLLWQVAKVIEMILQGRRSSANI